MAGWPSAILVDLAQAEHLAEAGGGSVGRQPPRGGELGGRIKDPADEQRQHQVAAAVALGAEQRVETDPARGAEHGCGMAMRQRALDADGVLAWGDDGAALEHGAQALDVGGIPMGEVEQGALVDLAVLAPAFAQQDGGGRGAIGDGLDVHGP
jgi:hypothetical protein